MQSTTHVCMNPRQCIESEASVLKEICTPRLGLPAGLAGAQMGVKHEGAGRDDKTT